MTVNILSDRIFKMSERTEFSKEPWHQYYQEELKPKYLPVVRLLASRLQEGTKKKNPNSERRLVWWDIENHSIVVGETAHIIATNWSGKLRATPDEITSAALLHDVTKPQEIIFDDLEDTVDKRVMIKNLVTRRFATSEDLEKFDKDSSQGLNIYETAIHNAEAKSLLREHRNELSQFGNPRKILDLSASSGTPVIDMPQDEGGHHLPTPAHRIIFISDQLVQGTNVVPLEQRHRKARQMYNPVLIDRLYDYAYRCADEIADNLGLSSREELPEFIESQILSIN